MYKNTSKEPGKFTLRNLHRGPGCTAKFLVISSLKYPVPALLKVAASVNLGWPRGFRVHMGCRLSSENALWKGWTLRESTPSLEAPGSFLFALRSRALIGALPGVPTSIVLHWYMPGPFLCTCVSVPGEGEIKITRKSQHTRRADKGHTQCVLGLMHYLIKRPRVLSHYSLIVMRSQTCKSYSSGNFGSNLMHTSAAEVGAVCFCLQSMIK